MKWAAIAAILAIAVGAGLGPWLYRGTVECDHAIKARLVSEAQLSNPSDSEAAAIKLAPIQCERVFDLRSIAFAHALKRDEIDALWLHCQRVADIASGLDKIERQYSPSPSSFEARFART